jgi:hypothetical protein
MAERQRLHRPDAARTGPVRRFAKLYSTHGQSFSNGQQHTPEVTPGGEGNGSRPEGDANVRTAYSVLERHLNEGRRTAETLSGPLPSGIPPINSLQPLLDEFIRIQTQLWPIWFQTVSALFQNGAAANQGLSPDGTDNGVATGQGNGAAAATVSIELRTNRAVQLSVELRPHSASMLLASPGLSSLEPGKPPITEVAFVRQDPNGEPKLSLRIPDNQPAGTYAGVIVNRDTGEVRGTLTARVS